MSPKTNKFIHQILRKTEPNEDNVLNTARNDSDIKWLEKQFRMPHLTRMNKSLNIVSNWHDETIQKAFEIGKKYIWQDFQQHLDIAQANEAKK